MKVIRRNGVVEILGGKIVKEDVVANARGGTELVAESMVFRLPKELLEDFQIVFSRVRKLDDSKIKIFVAQDLPGDPESAFLANGGYNVFDKLVFVSNWQMQRYIEYYGIPWHKCVVIKNAIKALRAKRKSRLVTEERDPEIVKLVYHTTPHRGLTILSNVFSNMAAKDEKLTLDVYSSFKIYGWEERDREYEDVFNFLKDHPQVNYHGSVPHEELIENLRNYDIFAYPNIWPETSCMSLMEAMSNGLLCVHPNYAVLPETAANWTWMYQYHENVRDHTRIFQNNLEMAVRTIRDGSQDIENMLEHQSAYADAFYSWDSRAPEWEKFLEAMKRTVRR